MGAILDYARVSTGNQDVAGQTRRLARAGALKVFTDVRSGRAMDRPGLEALLADARPGDTLAVVRRDRLGRPLAELLATVAHVQDQSIALLSLEEERDTSAAAGERMVHVFGAMAQFERRLIADAPRTASPPAGVRGPPSDRSPPGRTEIMFAKGSTLALFI